MMILYLAPLPPLVVSFQQLKTAQNCTPVRKHKLALSGATRPCKSASIGDTHTDAIVSK